MITRFKPNLDIALSQNLNEDRSKQLAEHLTKAVRKER